MVNNATLDIPVTAGVTHQNVRTELVAKPVVCLMGANFGTANMGVNALTVGAVKVILHRWPEARIFILDYGTDPVTYVVHVGNSRVNVPVVNLRFSKKLYLRNHILALIGLLFATGLVPGKKCREWACRTNPWLGKLYEVDIVASVAAGDSFSDIYGIINFFYVTLPQLLCLMLGKRLILFPQTFGPFKSRIARLVARVIFRKAERVYSRDYTGVVCTRDLVGPRKTAPSIRFCPDLGILLSPTPIRDPDFETLSAQKGSRSLIGFNVSGLLSNLGAKFGERAAFAADYDTLVRDLIDYLIQSGNFSVLLVPHVLGVGAESDALICQKLYVRLRPEYPQHFGIVTRNYDQHQIKHLIGSCDFFIGSRMHASIAAVSQGVPAVSLAYSDKFAGVMETMGAPQLVADLRTMKFPEVLQVVSSALENREAHRDRLRRRMPLLQDSVLNLLADVEL